MPGEKAPVEERKGQILDAAYHVALRGGIDAVTLRTVATEAGLSHGLIAFHFGRKDQLVAALLDRLLTTTSVLHVADDVERQPRSPEEVRDMLRGEVEKLAATPRDLRLFFEYWALGVRDPAIRARIGTALDRYRAAFRTLAADVLRLDSTDHGGVTPAGFAAAAVSLISGGAVQAAADPDTFDMAAYLATVKGILERLSAPTDHAPISP